MDSPRRSVQGAVHSPSNYEKLDFAETKRTYMIETFRLFSVISIGVLRLNIIETDAFLYPRV